MLKQLRNISNYCNIGVDTSAAQSLFAEYLHWYAGYYHWFRDIQSRKNGKNIQAICRALCAKGLRIWENSVCENRGVNAQNERKIWDFYQKTALNRHIFKMSENGRLKFQRSQSQLKKVRD